MSDNGPGPTGPDTRSPADKRSTPIVQGSGRRDIAPKGSPGRVRRAGSRRQARIALFVILVVAGVLIGGYFLFIPRDKTYTITDFTTSTVQVVTLQDTVELSGTVSARSEATVTAPEAGTLARLLVQEGDWVEQGQLLAVLQTDDLQDELDSARLDLEKQQRDYNRFLLQHQYDLRSYERQRAKLVETLEDAQTAATETKDLLDLGSASQSELDDAEKAVEDAQDAIDDHDAEVEEAVAIHELDKSNYEDDIASGQDKIARLEERIQSAYVKSPMNGRIISLADAATINGEQLSQYETLMNIADSRNPLIETEIEEQYVSVIQVGQPVSVDLSGTSVAGSIERIGLTASSSTDGGTPTVELDVAVEVGDAEITIGTSTVVTVLIGEVPDAVVLPRGPYLTSGNRKYLYRVEGDVASRVEVTYGTITDSWVEILSGVAKGDEIITSTYTNFIDRKTVRLGGDK